MTSRRFWAALTTLCTALALATTSAAEQAPAGSTLHPPDAGTSARTGDAGALLAHSSRDGGPKAPPLSDEDREVVDNLELLEHLQESEVLDLLLPLRDE